MCVCVCAYITCMLTASIVCVSPQHLSANNSTTRVISRRQDNLPLPHYFLGPRVHSGPVKHITAKKKPQARSIRDFNVTIK